MCFSSSNAQFLIILLMRKSAMKCGRWLSLLIFPMVGYGYIQQTLATLAPGKHQHQIN